VLVHAPALDGSDAAAGWYTEVHDIADVVAGTNEFIVTLGTRSGNTIIPQTLNHIFRRDPTAGASPKLADAMAKLSGATLSPSDYYDAPDTLINGALFADAFAEYYILSDGPWGFVPMPYFGTSTESLLKQFAGKWAERGSGTAATPNHSLLVVGSSDMQPTPGGTGLTISQVPALMSFIWRGTIEARVSASLVDVFASKTAVHELAHQFRPNSIFNNGDHCPALTTTYDSSTIYCLLSAIDTGGLVEAQRTNGVAEFHMLQPTPGGPWHSEYLSIRTHADPLVP
jgi:hypothetical protein